MTPQYRTIVDDAGWLDVSDRGRLRFAGPDAASFLHALVTNDVENLPIGGGTYAAWLTPRGRMVSDLRLLRTAEGVLAEVPAGLAQTLRDRFNQLIFSEDVVVTDVSADVPAWIVVGGRAADAAAAAAGAQAGAVGALPMFGHLATTGGVVVRTDETALPTFEVWHVPSPGGAVVDAELIDALRIEAGRPRWGHDMSGDTIPLEAGLLERAISQTKGCYVGQEVIVRVLHRGGGKVAKRLVRITFDQEVAVPPAAGEVLLVDGAEAGHVTSAAVGPSSGRVVALGYLQRDAAEVDRVVRTSAGAAGLVNAFAG